MKLFPLAAYRKWLLGIGVLAGITFWVFYLINTKDFLSLSQCDYGLTACRNNVEILDAFYSGFFLKLIILTTVLLMFLPERVYKWWRWSALIAIPYAALDIVTTKTNISGIHAGVAPHWGCCRSCTFYALFLTRNKNTKTEHMHHVFCLT